MNLLATASDLQIKGLSQIQETRTTQLTSEATPLPEVKPAAKQTPLEVNKVKPAAELRVKPVAPAPPPPSSQEGRLSQESPDYIQHPQHSGNSLKRKHDQSGSDHHSRISFRNSSSSNSGWSGGGSSQHSSRHLQQQQDCEERQTAVALRDLKTEVGDLGSSGSSGSTGALAPLHSEDNTRVTTQVLPYLQQQRYRYFI
jgi:hypothetical protein